MSSSITSDTDVFGYLLPDGTGTSRVNLYASMLEADPSAVLVPMNTRLSCLDSALHTVRTGLVRGMLIDPAFYSDASELVDSLTGPAIAAGIVDTVFLDRMTGKMVGDCAAVKAYSSVASGIASVEDPVVLLYGNGWDTRVAMAALSGTVTLMCVAAERDPVLDSIPTGCVVEYCGEDREPDPFDLVSSPPEGFSGRDGQLVIGIADSRRSMVAFEAMRLAESVGKIRGLPGGMAGMTAEQYKKILFDI